MTPLVPCIGDAIALIRAQATALWATVDVCRLMTTAADTNLLHEMHRMTVASSYVSTANPVPLPQASEPPAAGLRYENSSVYSDDGGFHNHVFGVPRPPQEADAASDFSLRSQENFATAQGEEPQDESGHGPGRLDAAVGSTVMGTPAEPRVPEVVQPERRLNAISVTLPTPPASVESISNPAVNEVHIVVGPVQNTLTVRTSSSQIDVDMPN